MVEKDQESNVEWRKRNKDRHAQPAKALMVVPPKAEAVRPVSVVTKVVTVGLQNGMNGSTSEIRMLSQGVKVVDGKSTGRWFGSRKDRYKSGVPGQCTQHVLQQWTMSRMAEADQKEQHPEVKE